MTNKKEYYKKHNMTFHGDKPSLFEYDPKNDIIDVFVYLDQGCPYPFTITNTHKREDIWYHQGFYLEEFMILLDIFLQKNNLPYELIEKI